MLEILLLALAHPQAIPITEKPTEGPITDETANDGATAEDNRPTEKDIEGATANPEPYFVGAWAIFTEEEGCLMSSEYEDDNFLFIRYNPRASSVWINFTNTTATSLESGQEVSLNVFFFDPSNRRSTMNDWDDTEFLVWKSDMIRFFSQAFDTIILDDISKYEGLSFFVGENVIESFRLTGSARAVSELRKCAFDAAGLNPDDPFLK